MTAEFITTFTANSLWIALLISMPVLGLGLIVGLLVSLFQAVTSIQEMTLTFIPKILAVIVALLIFLPWMLNILVNYTKEIITNIPYYIR